MKTSKYTRSDYYEKYDSIMKFTHNKNSYIHGWYPFVEGYSKEFINSIISELDYSPTHCLEPFAGSGTTPLELQELGIKCSSFEVSPFMHTLSTTKLYTDYTLNEFEKNLIIINKSLKNYNNNIESLMDPPNFRTIVQNENLKKWNFNKEIMRGLLDIKYVISLIKCSHYQNLFRIALASILLKVSNVYRNGKCLSYKEDWEKKITYSRTDVHEIYIKTLIEKIKPDIITMENNSRSNSLVKNIDFCYLGDVRSKINIMQDNSIDLIITSPPYLNSRDYTDTYMIELRMLDYVKNYEDLRNHRSKTLRSHVQVKWDEVETLNISNLVNAINKIELYKEDFWNKSLLNMIKGYFEDMNNLFLKFNNKMKYGGKIFFNVANSSYYGVKILTDEIVCEIAEKHGFVIEEIRNARKIKPSVQQQNDIDYLIESVVVMKKPFI